MLAYLYEFHLIYYLSTPIVRQFFVWTSLWIYGFRLLSSKNMVAISYVLPREESQKNCRIMITVNLAYTCVGAYNTHKKFYFILSQHAVGKKSW